MGLEPVEEVNAKKTTLTAGDALKLARQAAHLYVAKGQRVTHVDVQREKPDDETLKQLLLGPTGNLRAPTLRVGKTLLVGFNRDMYDQMFDGT